MMFVHFLAVLSLLASGVGAFTSLSASTSNNGQILSLSMAQNYHDDGDQEPTSRRSFFVTSAAVASSLIAVGTAQAVEERQGIEVTPFNGLIFNYRNSQFGGLDAAQLDEPSVSYKEFCERLAKGEVEFVEFLAPDGDAAYVTFKKAAADNQTNNANGPIRIGDGYPIEQHDGWSSPAFAVRTVKDAGVPYKFTVPALAKYSSK